MPQLQLLLGKTSMFPRVVKTSILLGVGKLLRLVLLFAVFTTVCPGGLIGCDIEHEYKTFTEGSRDGRNPIDLIWNFSDSLLKQRCYISNTDKKFDSIEYKSNDAMYPDGRVLDSTTLRNLVLHTRFSNAVLEQCIVKGEQGWYAKTKIVNAENLKSLYSDDAASDSGEVRELLLLSKRKGVNRVLVFSAWFPFHLAGGLGQGSFEVLRLGKEEGAIVREKRGDFAIFNSDGRLMSLHNNGDMVEANFDGYLDGDSSQVLKLKLSLVLGSDGVTQIGPIESK